MNRPLIFFALCCLWFGNNLLIAQTTQLESLYFHKEYLTDGTNNLIRADERGMYTGFGISYFELNNRGYFVRVSKDSIQGLYVIPEGHHVRDFRVYGDNVVFCGYREASIRPIGLLGTFKTNVLYDPTIPDGMVYHADTSTDLNCFSRITCFYNAHSDAEEFAAIGIALLSGIDQSIPIVVHGIIDSLRQNSGQYIPHTAIIPSSSSEIFDDIVSTDNYVAIVGNHPNGYFVRYATHTDLTEATNVIFSDEYYYVTDPVDPINGMRLCATRTTGDEIAVATAYHGDVNPEKAYHVRVLQVETGETRCLQHVQLKEKAEPTEIAYLADNNSLVLLGTCPLYDISLYKSYFIILNLDQCVDNAGNKYTADVIDADDIYQSVCSYNGKYFFAASSMYWFAQRANEDIQQSCLAIRTTNVKCLDIESYYPQYAPLSLHTPSLFHISHRSSLHNNTPYIYEKCRINQPE